MEDSRYQSTDSLQTYQSDSLESTANAVPVASYASAPSNYVAENLEVHEPGFDTNSQKSSEALSPPHAFKFSRHKAILVSAVIALIVVLLSGVSITVLNRQKKDAPSPAVNNSVPVQEVELSQIDSVSQAPELVGAQKHSLLINGDIISRGILKLSKNAFMATIESSELVASQNYKLPNASGAFCLDSNNCNFASQSDLAQFATLVQLNQLRQLIPVSGDETVASLTAGSSNLNIIDDGDGNLTITDTAAGSPRVTTLNGASGVVTLSVQGTPNQITVNASGNTFTLATPQDINTGSSPTFNGLILSSLNCTGMANGGTLTTNGSGQVVCADDDGAAGSSITGSGAIGSIAKFDASQNIVSSIITESGTVITVGGSVTASSFSGSGVNLTALNASSVSSGTLSDLRLSTNVSLLGQTIGLSELEADSVNSSKVVDGSIANIDLTNSSLSVAAGGGLVDGGSVSLGGSTTLNIGAGDGITVNPDNVAVSVQANKGLEVDGNGLSLIDCADGQVLKYNTTGSQWACAADAGASGTGDDVYVNGSPATNANFINNAASATVPSVTWSLTAVNPDTIGLTIGAASATTAGVVTNGAQSFGGDKTFASNVIVQGGTATLGSTANTGSLVLHDNDGVGSETVTITTPNVSSSYTLTLPTAVGVTNQCLKAQNGTGTLFWDDCEGGLGSSPGITSINGEAGPAITISNASVTAADTITIDDASTGAKGIASFSSSFFTVTAGAVSIANDSIGDTQLAFNTGQHLTTTSTPTFTTATLTNLVVASQSFNDLTGNGLTISTNALTVQAAASTDALSATTSSGSGLEVLSSGITLLQGCANNDILKWNETTDVWACSADNNSGGSITAVGSFTSGAAFAGLTADDQCFGLTNDCSGLTTAGRIEFDDQAIDEINFLNARVGIGTSTPLTTLDVAGTGRFMATIDVPDNTGAALQYLNYTNISDNVGATATQLIGLDLQGTVNAAGAGGTQETIGIFVRPLNGSPGAGTQNNYGIRIDNQGLAGSENAYGLYVNAQTGSSNNYAAVFSGGNVGIGTATPAAKLSIETTASTVALNTFDGTVTTNIFNGTASSLTGGWIGTASNHSLIFMTNNTDRAVLDSAGNLGLGVVPTTAKFEVAGNGLFKSTSTAALDVQSASSVSMFSVDTTNNRVFVGEATGAVSSGRLVISDPTTMATGVGAAINLRAKINSSGTYGTTAQLNSYKENSTNNDYSTAMFLQTADAGGTLRTRMRLAANGNVSIGANNINGFTVANAKLAVWDTTTTPTNYLLALLSDVGGSFSSKFLVRADGRLVVNTETSAPTATQEGELIFGRVGLSSTDGRIWLRSGGDTFRWESDNDTADYSEYFYKVGQGVAGDVMVVADGTSPAHNTGQVVRGSRPYDSRTVGVITERGTGNNNPDDDRHNDPNFANVGMLGHVPVKIAADSPAIYPGDMLTTSYVSGRAMKADRAGMVIGRALESWVPGSGEDKIMMLVNPGWYEPADENGILQGSFQSLDVLGQSNLANLNVTGAITTSSLNVTGSATVNGVLEVVEGITTAKITISGHLTVGKDTSGTLVVPAGQTEAMYSFENAYQRIPKLTASADGFVLIKVVEKTETSFKIQLQTAQPSDTTIDWIALEPTQ